MGIGGLFTAVGDCRFNAPYLKTLYDYLDLPNKMYKGSLTTEKRSDRQYTVEFLDVSFRYPGSEQYALRHLSMTFKVGERLAVVGMNGSGKTTFIKLLCRLYDPTEGVILLNGIDIRKYRYDEYMDIFSVVFQDSSCSPCRWARMLPRPSIMMSPVPPTACKSGLFRPVGPDAQGAGHLPL